MSELKAINAYRLTTNTEDCDVYIHNDEFDCGGDLVECYLKSEADKVIAEKEAEIAELKEQVHDYALGSYVMQAMAEKEARHDKYKRCLAMAYWCSAELGMLVSTWESKIKYYKRWQKRWLELAEKFKEV